MQDCLFGHKMNETTRRNASDVTILEYPIWPTAIKRVLKKNNLTRVYFMRIFTRTSRLLGNNKISLSTANYCFLGIFIYGNCKMQKCKKKKKVKCKLHTYANC